MHLVHDNDDHDTQYLSVLCVFTAFTAFMLYIVAYAYVNVKKRICMWYCYTFWDYFPTCAHILVFSWDFG